jgi:subtilisin family serine protease
MRTVPRRSSIALLLAVAAALAAPAAASADEGQIIVKFASGADAHDRSDARQDARVAAAASLPLDGTQLVTPQRGTTVAKAVAALERSRDVVYAEPDAARSAFAAPTSDADFGDQWALQNTGQDIFDSFDGRWTTGLQGSDIDVVPAWGQGITESAVTVGVVDSGVDLEHPDLKPNILPGGKDYVDGDATPMDQNGHGTHVAGIIGAVGNNGTGVTGVAWKAGILPVRVLNAKGSGSVTSVVNGYNWAVSHGARIVNVSLGGSTPSQTEYDALLNARNTLFVVAAGNDGVDVDTTDSYPCAYDLPNVLCVAATGGNDQLAGFSDYGAQTVDIAAPGVDILSTYPTAFSAGFQQGPYEWMSGTSMATPEVSGAAALVLDQDPSLTPWQLREKLMSSVDKVAGLEGKVSSGGRLDVAAALAAPAPTDATPSSSSTAPVARQAPTGTTTTTPAPATPVVTQPSTPVATSPAVTTPVTTTPAPAKTSPAVDRTAPAVSATLSGRGALRALLAGRLRVSTTASERAAVRVELRVDGRTARKLRLTTRASTVTVATGSGSLPRAGRTSVTVRVSARAKRALANVRSLKVSLRAAATDVAGNGRTRSRTLTLSR